jgi:VIT1/CCC1 family predicted Fe2+/Mn2+ transporter
MDRHKHILLEKGHTRNTLRDLILGGQDGLVNVLGIVFGVSAAGGSTHIILAAGLAATFAEAVSMGAVDYTSILSERDHYLKELSQEKKEIKFVPGEEEEEIRAIYRKKGFEGILLEQIVDQLIKNKRVWADTMMSDELKLEPVETKDVIVSSLVVGISTVVGSLIPLLPYFVYGSHPAIYGSLILSAITLFAVGFYQAKSYVGNPFKKGMQMLLIGMGAAVVGFVIGKIFNAA